VSVPSFRMRVKTPWPLLRTLSDPRVHDIEGPQGGDGRGDAHHHGHEPLGRWAPRVPSTTPSLPSRPAHDLSASSSTHITVTPPSPRNQPPNLNALRPSVTDAGAPAVGAGVVIESPGSFFHVINELNMERLCPPGWGTQAAAADLRGERRLKSGRRRRAWRRAGPVPRGCAEDWIRRRREGVRACVLGGGDGGRGGSERVDTQGRWGG